MGHSELSGFSENIEIEFLPFMPISHIRKIK